MNRRATLTSTMQRTTLRSLYGGFCKPRNQAEISPTVDDVDFDDNDNLSMGEKGDGFSTRSHASLQCNEMDAGNNRPGAAVSVKVHESIADPEYKLQRKSNSRSGDVGMLSRLGVGYFFTKDDMSNQVHDAFAGPPMYTVLGQKQQWRQSRAGRSRQHQTISPVDESYRAERAESDTFDFRRDKTISSSSDESRSSKVLLPIDPLTGQSVFLHSGSSERGSDYSLGRSQGESSKASDDSQRFIVTRQKKSKYSAKLHLHGQKPLYLGRYKNQEAALAACESAYTVVSTPRK